MTREDQSNKSAPNPKATAIFEINENGLQSFVEDVQYLWCHSSSNHNRPIAVLEDPPSVVEFLRDYVSISRPCIIRNALFFRWTVQDLVNHYPSKDIVVDVSPDGHADVLRDVHVHSTEEEEEEEEDGVKESRKHRKQKVFVQPEQRLMTVSSFHERLMQQSHQIDKESIQQEPLSRVFQASSSPSSENEKYDSKSKSLTNKDDSVFYYSRQNDCLRQELSQFWESISDELPRTIPWAEEAFGTGPPQAVNLWMGNERSVSSMHKDHYENLFYVASGQKVFTLCPPADAPFLYEEEYDSGRFYWNNVQQQWQVQLDVESDESAPSRVRWIAADVSHKHDSKYLEAFPLLQYTHPIEVKVNAGELLYLPALWFHRVTQTCETMGINYWYDMKFESPVWTFFHFLQQLQSTT